MAKAFKPQRVPLHVCRQCYHEKASHCSANDSREYDHLLNCRKAGDISGCHAMTDYEVSSSGEGIGLLWNECKCHKTYGRKV